MASSLSNASKPWNLKTSLEKYHTMGSWFLGPRGENAEIMKQKLESIVEKVRDGRLDYWPEDPDFITSSMTESQDFQDSINLLQLGLDYLGEGLAAHSVPFYSTRHAGHMNSDISMPATLGYAIAQQYNQNNVAPEGGPFTSYIEWEVGQQLCKMLGYSTPNKQEEPDEIAGWGHITAGGSIANLESMWIARNLKYYGLSLHQAMGPGQPLAWISATFNVNLCNGTQKNLYSCRPWELLNLSPTEVADIPGRLFKEYGISSDALSKQLEKFSIQTTGKAHLDAIYKINKAPQYLLSVANHYSWPKGCAITGIGRENLITIDVDNFARMDAAVLEKKLLERLAEERAVYAVVVIAGELPCTTEHGAVDPLQEVLAIRERLQKKGMSFMVHADAAWGGYFATKAQRPTSRKPVEEYAFSIPLNEWTFTQLSCLRDADSITLDPHKSGFVPYPAGALCIRDDRHRFLTTWASPYINVDQGSDIAMGIYGVEGSKPGAAPVAAWLSHLVIGLLDGGYQDLLGTTMLTGIKMYAHWVTLSLKSSVLTVTPLNMLPIEREKPNASKAEIRAAQDEILEKIVKRRNDELENDPNAMELISKIGGDTMINAFACNFKVGGVLNTDVVEANFLNQRLYQRLSIQSPKDDIKDKPLIIMRTEMYQSAYKECLTKFKSRIGVSGPENLVVLSNVSMSPFPTAGQFLTVIMDAFQKTAEEEIKNCLVRIEKRPSVHSFVIHGTDALYLSYLPMFHVENHRRQLIVAGTLSRNDMEVYTRAKKQNQGATFTIHTKSGSLNDLTTLDKILQDKKFTGDIYQGLPDVYGVSPIVKNVEFTITSVRTDQSLHRQNLQAYPNAMPFVLYGNSKEYHIDHILQAAPNAHMIASGVKLTLDSCNSLDDCKQYTLTLDKMVEWAMQPFSNNQPPAFFAPGATFDVTIQEEGSCNSSTIKGKLTLPQNPGNIFIDYKHLNEEITADIYVMVPKTARTKPDLSFASYQQGSQQFKNDIDSIARTLVTRFGTMDITWSDNVPLTLGRMLPLANQYLVKLGAPDAATVKPGAFFAVVSRFNGKYPTHPEARKLANHKAWVDEFSQRFQAASRIEPRNPESSGGNGYKILVRIDQSAVDSRQRFNIVEKTAWHYANGGNWGESNGRHALTMGGSGTSGTLRFESSTGEIFIAALGVHNYKRWCDLVADLGRDQTGERIQAEYYSVRDREAARERQLASYSLKTKGRNFTINYTVTEGNCLEADIIIGGETRSTDQRC